MCFYRPLIETARNLSLSRASLLFRRHKAKLLQHTHGILLEPFFDDLASGKAVDVHSRKGYSLTSRGKRSWRLESTGIGAMKSPARGHFVCFSDLVLTRDLKVGEEAMALGDPAFVVLAA